ncbi:11 transmembrane domain protein, related [Eimeria mitis]|uniref:11 transmembrane domain protein, related n=1 Tax=Eimeria mitis TaxID=44415 RepID=U6KD81_9EIME|nr:11 transmembrane domain protein, related [Eimeria mitis]CDJ35884.1 11 transmembrane domain protein, related [Eimeria mitis]
MPGHEDCCSGRALKALRMLCRALPRADLPGAKQATPLNLNRYVLLFLYMLQTFMTGCVYFGWAPLSAMLLRAGVFSFKCDTDEMGAFVNDQREFGNNYICDKQDASVQSLFVITLATHCTMSALAGAMMDTLGPKITSVIGQCFNIIAWSIIATLKADCHASIYLGFIFLGLGADTAFLPTLLVTRLFPGSAATVIALIGSASSASFAIPLILDLYLTKNGISGCWWYVGFGPCLFLLVDALAMPLKAFDVFEADSAEEQGDVSIEDNTQLECLQFSDRETGMSGSETDAMSPVEPKCQLEGKEPGDALIKHAFSKTVFSEKYILIVTYFVAVGWVTAFYQEAHDRILEPAAEDFLGSALPFSFIPCILLGKLSETIGILAVMGIVNTAGLLAYSFSLKQTLAMGVFSVLCFTVYMALFVSQVFVYVEENFPAKFFGRLIGIVQLVGGLSSLLCSPLFHLVSVGSKGLYLVQLPMIGVLLLMYFVLARLWCIRMSPLNLRTAVNPDRQRPDSAPQEP